MITEEISGNSKNWSHSQSSYEHKTFREFLRIVSMKYMYDPKIKHIMKDNVIYYLTNILEENFQRDINKGDKEDLKNMFNISKYS